MHCPPTPRCKAKLLLRRSSADRAMSIAKSPFRRSAMGSFPAEELVVSLDATIEVPALLNSSLSPILPVENKFERTLLSPNLSLVSLCTTRDSPECARNVRRRMSFQVLEQSSQFLELENQNHTVPDEIHLKRKDCSHWREVEPGTFNTESTHNSTTSTEDLEIGNRTEEHDFVLEEKIGEGISAHVWKAQNRKTKKFVAIKRSNHCSRSEIKVWTKEFRAVRRLQPNDNLVRYLDAWQEDGYFNIAMELCTEGSLAEMIARNCAAGVRMSVEDMARTAADVASGLAAMHEARLLHLDIKPDNLLLCGSVVKIGDFGLCVDEGKWDDQEGDSRYIAPELLQGVATGAADMFSLGLVLLQLALGLSDLPRNGPAWALLRTKEEIVCSVLRSRNAGALVAADIEFCWGKIAESCENMDSSNSVNSKILSLLRMNHEARPSATKFLDEFRGHHAAVLTSR